jgi:hypothetical protein
VNFLATDKALLSCSKSVIIIGQAFEHVTAFADVLKVSDDLWMLKMTSMQSPRVDYMFLCSLFNLTCLRVILTFNSVGLQSAAENCIQVDFVAIPDSGNSHSMTEMELADFATGLADFENASASYCPCGEHVCSLAAMHVAV